jgi:hypothetical protein
MQCDPRELGTWNLELGNLTTLHCAAHGLQSCGEGRHRAHKQHTHHWCRPLEGSIGSACGTMMSATLSARALRRVRGVLVAAFVCVSAIQTTVFVSRTHAAVDTACSPAALHKPCAALACLLAKSAAHSAAVLLFNSTHGRPLHGSLAGASNTKRHFGLSSIEVSSHRHTDCMRSNTSSCTLCCHGCDIVA